MTATATPPMSGPERIVRRYFQRLLVERDLSVCEELLAADYLDHDAPPDSPRGPGPTRAYVERMLRDYPDLEFTIHEVVSQGHSVALRATWHGTHRETRALFQQHGIALLHLDPDGRIVERWSAYGDGAAD
jgi:ketosteroid isomerase-like protein